MAQKKCAKIYVRVLRCSVGPTEALLRGVVPGLPRGPARGISPAWLAVALQGRALAATTVDGSSPHYQDLHRRLLGAGAGCPARPRDADRPGFEVLVRSAPGHRPDYLPLRRLHPRAQHRANDIA